MRQYIVTLWKESENFEVSTMVARNWQDHTKRNHTKTTNVNDQSTCQCTYCNQTCHTKSRCFELVGYPEWWDHNYDTQKKNSKKSSTAAVIKTKTEDNVAEKSSTFVAAADNSGKVLNMSTSILIGHG